MEPTIHFLYINAPFLSVFVPRNSTIHGHPTRNICTRTSSKATSRRECWRCTQPSLVNRRGCLWAWSAIYRCVWWKIRKRNSLWFVWNRVYPQIELGVFPKNRIILVWLVPWFQDPFGQARKIYVQHKIVEVARWWAWELPEPPIYKYLYNNIWYLSTYRSI